MFVDENWKKKLKSKRETIQYILYLLHLYTCAVIWGGKFNNDLELHFNYSHVFYIEISLFLRPHMWIFINPCGFVFDLL